jgi:glycosyltransferase involved in cell wall biosynthesis
MPKLSICIPTYNRATLLRDGVAAILSDIVGLDAELIVSDNASTDQTATVMGQFLGNRQLRYHRNESNVGPAPNMGVAVHKLATGDFLWFLGDDDLIVEGAAKRIIKIIEENSEISYIFANYSHLEVSRRAPYSGNLRSSDFGSDLVPLCTDRGSRLLPTWEQTLLLSDIEAAQTFIGCHIARAELWRAGHFTGTVDCQFRTFAHTFPHLETLVPQIVSRPVYYCGAPLSILCFGAQEWFDDNWTRLLYTHVLEFSDGLERMGVADNIVDHYRNCVFSSRHSLFTWITASKTPLSWKAFFLTNLCVKYGKYPKFRAMMIQRLKSVLRPRTRIRSLGSRLSQ